MCSLCLLCFLQGRIQLAITHPTSFKCQLTACACRYPQLYVLPITGSIAVIAGGLLLALLSSMDVHKASQRQRIRRDLACRCPDGDHQRDQLCTRLHLSCHSQLASAHLLPSDSHQLHAATGPSQAVSVCCCCILAQMSLRVSLAGPAQLSLPSELLQITTCLTNSLHAWQVCA